MFDMPEMPKRQQRKFEIVGPHLGIYLARPGLEIPDGGFSDGLNVRIRDSKLTNRNVGYESFTALSLGNQVLLIDDFVLSNGSSVSIFGTKSDLFYYDTGSEEPVYITPNYQTGTVTVTNGIATVTGAGTAWMTNAKVGDQFSSGVAGEDTIDAIWYTILTVDSDTQITLDANYAEATLGGQSYTIRNLFTADDSDWWDSDVFPDAPLGTTSGLGAGDHWFATNGSELVVWDGNADTVVVIAANGVGLDFTCKTLSYYKNMMIYGNITESGTSRPANFKNTAISDPENVTTLEANEFTMAEGIDFLTNLIRLGDFIVGYCDYSINVAQFVSAPFYFAIRTAAPGIGLYGPQMVVDFGDFHEFLSTDQAYRFDGVRLQPFGNQIFSEVLRIADRSRASKSIVGISKEELEIYWCVALSSDGAGTNKSAEIAWTEHYAENVGNAPTPFLRRQLPATAFGLYVSALLGRFSDFTEGFDDVPFSFNDRFFTAEFPALLMGDEDGFLWRMNTTSSLGDEPVLLSYLTSPLRPLWDGSDKGIIRRVEPHLERGSSSGQLLIQTRTEDRVEGSLETSSSQGIDIDGDGSRFSSYRSPGRYGQIRMYTTDPADTWTLHGYMVTTERLGER